MLLGARRDRMVLRREPIERPTSEAAASFVCPACDVVLWDGVVYATCPVCDLPVDWVDLAIPVWCCPGCDRMINEDRENVPRCAPCARPLLRIHALEHPPAEETAPEPRGRFGVLWDRALQSLAAGLLLLGAMGPLLSLALDPEWRLLALALGAPVLLLPLTMAGVFLWSLGASLRELRALVRHRKTRVIHGFEHATAKVLEAEGHLVTGA